MDPTLHQARGAMDDAELRAHRERNRALVETSAPVMAAARDFLSDSGSVLLLTDARGLIVGVEGDPDTLEQAREIRLVPGVSWGELAIGTNAIGTALAIGQPVQVHAAEHFCEGIKLWTCSAAAVRDPCDGSIVGALDVSGASGSYSRQSLAFVVSAATQIETGLFGKPKQGYGFSNNPSSMFGPPNFSSAAFEYKGGNLTLPVQLSY